MKFGSRRREMAERIRLFGCIWHTHVEEIPSYCVRLTSEKRKRGKMPSRMLAARLGRELEMWYRSMMRRNPEWLERTDGTPLLDSLETIFSLSTQPGHLFTKVTENVGSNNIFRAHRCELCLFVDYLVQSPDFSTSMNAATSCFLRATNPLKVSIPIKTP